MTQTSVVADLLQALQVLAQLGTNIVGNKVSPLAVNAVLGSVKKPTRNSVCLGLSHDLDDLVDLISADLSRTANSKKKAT